MIALACHCGAVTLEVESAPEFINACNCSLCIKLGAHWGYFDPAQAKITGKSAIYCRSDKAEPGAQMHFCQHCGTTTYFTLTQASIAKFGRDVLGVNMCCAEQSDLAGIELRFPDGKAWSGEGEFGHVRDPIIIGQATG